MIHVWPFAHLDAPIVLAHGLGGFSRIGVGRMTLTTYFRGIPEALRASGNRVLVTRVPPLAGVEKRAQRLGEQIVRAFGDEPVHLIGHSMGGLDSRRLLADPAWPERVLSLTTIGTPHLGSSLADFAKIRVGRIYDMLAAVGIDPQGCLDVTCGAARRFHERNPLPSGVPCFCVAGDPVAETVCWPLRRLHAVLSQMEGPNDGLVSVASAHAFGTPLPVWPADHLQQLNWVARVEHPAISPTPLELYAQVVAHLAALGFGSTPDPQALSIAQQTTLLVPGSSTPNPTSLAG
jgi:triacylglycerol lipase